MNSSLRLLFLLFIAITAIKTNAQTYKFENGVFRPTTSEERYKPPPVKYNTPTPRAEKSTGTNSGSRTSTSGKSLIEIENEERAEREKEKRKLEKLKNDSIAKVKEEKVAYYERMYEEDRRNDDEMWKLYKITGVKYDHAYKHDGYMIVEKGSKQGIINSVGKIMVPLLYGKVYPFKEDLAEVELNSKHGAVDKNGIVVIPIVYDIVYQFYGDLAIVCVGEKHGFEYVQKYGAVNKNGTVVIPIIYNKISGFEKGFSTVLLDGKWGLVSKIGKLVIPAKYEDLDYLGSFADYTTYAAKLDNKWGLINTNGTLLSPFIYEEIKDTWRHSGFYIVLLGAKLGLISLTGELILPAEYERLKKLDGPAENIYSMYTDYRYGYVNPKEKTLISCVFSETADFDFNNGLAEVKMPGKDGKWGYIDLNLKTIIPCIYTTVDHFSEGLAAVSYNNRYGYIDIKGNVVIPFKYRYAKSFYKGRAEVNKSKNLKKDTYIDASGKELKD